MTTVQKEPKYNLQHGRGERLRNYQADRVGEIDIYTVLLPIYLPIYLSIYLSICLSIYLSN